MPEYDIQVGNSTYRVDAPSEDVLPEIADAIARENLIPNTALEEYAGAVGRGALPYAAGAVAGAVAGIPAGPAGMITGARVGPSVVEVGNIAGDITVPLINKLMGTRFTAPSEAWEHLADALNIPKPQTTGGKMTESAVRNVLGALAGAGAGQILQKSASPAVAKLGTFLAAAPEEQMAAGVGGAIVGEGASELAKEFGADQSVQNAANLVGSLAGTVLGAKGYSTLTGPQTVDPVVQLYKDLNLAAPTTSEVLPPKTLVGKAFRSFAANIPIVGAAGREEARAVELNKGIQDLIEGYGVKFGENAPFNREVFDDFVSNRQSKINGLVGQKQSIIGELSSIADNQVPMTNTLRTIDEEVSALKAANPTAFSGVTSQLEGIKNAITSNTLDNIEVNRALVGTMLQDPSLAAIKTQSNPSINRIYGAIKDDMRSFIQEKAGPQAVSKWEGANKQLEAMTEDLKNLSVKRALNIGDANPEVIGNILTNTTKKESFDRLVSGLSEKGKETAKQSILQSIANKSLSKVDGSFSVDAFKTQLINAKPNIDRLFSASERKVLKGWLEVLDRSQFARMFAPDVPTGQRTVVATTMSALGAFFLPKTLGLAAAHHAYESKYVRDLLTKIANNPINKEALITQAAKATQVFAVKELATQMSNQGVPITFAPQNVQKEQVGQGSVSTDLAHGYRAVSVNGTKQRLYGPDNKLIGVFDNMDQVRRYTDRQVIKGLSVPKE